jgi:gingipain R
MKFKSVILATIFLFTASVTKSQILIISADEYVNQMQPYIEWKSQKGLWCDLVKISEVGSTHNEVKEFVASYHNVHNNRYLLLVGDADKVPTHISYGETNPNEYSAYSDAEYGYIYSSDYPPTVLVGRFSGESSEDIATQVERTIYYERDIDASATWLSSSLGIANPNSYETGDNSETDYEHITNLNNKLNEAEYTTSITNNKTILKNTLNSGCGLINYIGHGYTTSWQTTSFSTNDVKSLTNANRLPIIIAAGCQNGHFRLTTCLAESFLRERDSNGSPIGAVGMLAFTTQIYWNPPMLAQDEFARILTTDSIGFTKSFGEVINTAYKGVIAKYKGSGADVACQWALFGDPSLILRTKAPTTMLINHNDKISANSNSFVVNCDTDYATATLWSNGEIIDSKQINSGFVTLNTEGLKSGDTAKLTITAQDKISYQADIEVNQESGIEQISEISEYSILPNPTNGEITIKGKNDIVKISVYDYSGRVILERTISTNAPFSLPIKRGNYLLHIANDKSTHSLLIRN